jgi:uncharacterized protein
MELTHEHGTGHFIKSYAAGKIMVDQTLFTHSLIIQPSVDVIVWRPTSFDEITIADIETLSNIDADIYLIGVGEHFKILDSKILTPLYNNKKGVDVMTTSAACRTYNILMSEDRRVVVAVVV